MPHKTRICFLVDHIATVGGVQRVVKVLSEALACTYNVTVFCGDNLSIDKVEIHGVRIRSFHGDNMEQSDRNIIAKVIDKTNKKTGVFNRFETNDILISAIYPKHVVNYWIEILNSYDIAIGVQGYFSFLLGVIGNRTKCRLVGWQHSSFLAYFRTKEKYSWNRDCIAKYAISRLDSYVVLNEAYREDIKREFGLNVDVIYNPRSFTSAKKSLLEEKNFLAAGHMLPGKGFDRLIDAFSIFAKSENEWKLHIYGEGPEKSSISRKVVKYGLDDRVILHPYTNDIKKCFMESSVFLLPSRWEGMPMMVLEALEMGLPVISFDIQAIRPMVTDGVEGYVVSDGDIHAFAHKLLKCTSDYIDGTLKQMSRNATSKSELFSIPSIERQWIQMFMRIMGDT